MLPMAMTALLLCAASASADWKPVGENGDAVVYADSTTISRSGNTAKLWHVNDLKAERTTLVTMSAGESYLSTKVRQEYDCRAQKVRVLAFAAHSHKMGGGKVVLSDNEASPWAAVSSDPITIALFKIACTTT